MTMTNQGDGLTALAGSKTACCDHDSGCGGRSTARRNGWGPLVRGAERNPNRHGSRTQSSMSVFDRPLLLAAPLLAAVALAAPAALAQTASQVAQPSYAPPVVRPAEDGGVTLDGIAGLDAPMGAERLKVTPSGLVIEGGRPELADETATIDAGLKGKTVTGIDLFAAARRLEEAYAKAGFLLVRVSLPPQTIKDGQPLRLVIIDGTVEAVDASALPRAVRGRIEALLAPLVGKAGLTRAELERRLLLAGDTPGTLLRSTLKAGARPGATVIVVDGRYDPVTGTISADNSLSPNLGRYTVGLGVEFNSLLGLGEVGYLRLNGYPGFGNDIFEADPRNRQLSAGVTLPVGIDGFWLNMEGVDSRTHPKSQTPYEMDDHFQRLSIRLGYGWLRSRDLNTSTVISFDLTEEKQRLTFGTATSPFTRDRLRVLRTSQTGDAAFGEGWLSGALTASFGLDGLGARAAIASLPLSRAGTEPAFRKLEAALTYSTLLFEDTVSMSVTGKAQTAFGAALPASEQFGLGGFGWLSAFDGGWLQGDGGAALRTELAFPRTTGLRPLLGNGWGGATSPYFFAAAGITHLERPTAVEAALTRASAIGAGLRFALSERASPNAATLTLEIARGEASGLTSRNRFNIRLTSRF